MTSLRAALGQKLGGIVDFRYRGGRPAVVTFVLVVEPKHFVVLAVVVVVVVEKRVAAL